MTKASHVVSVSALVPLLLMSLVPLAAAQSNDGRKWEVEFHGGGILTSNPNGGTVSLPSPAESFAAGPGFPTTRRVSSWYFGDGATLVNQVSAASPFNLALKITPLDPVLGGALADRRPGASLGARVSRRLNDRLTAEFSVDYSLARLKITSEGRAGIEASRASFLAVFSQFQTTSPTVFQQARVASNADIADGNARQVISTGVLNINLKAEGRLVPYAAVGGGVISNLGTSPSATLAGNYQFLYLNAFPINESDTVRVRASRAGHAFVGVFGGGVRWQAARRWGVRLDVREHLSRNDASTLVDANPATVAAIPSAFFFSTTNPSIYFSNRSSSPSSLSGSPLDGVQTFRGSGIQSRTSITVGAFWRF